MGERGVGENHVYRDIMHRVELLYRESSSGNRRRHHGRRVQLGMLIGLFIVGWHMEASAHIILQKSIAPCYRPGMAWQDVISQRSRADSLPNGAGAAGHADSTEVESKKNVEQMPTWSTEEFQRHLVYPAVARLNNIQGKVRVRALLDKTGRVVKTVVQPGAHPLLADAAVEALQKTSFTPAKENNQPVAVWIEIPVDFRLNDPPAEDETPPPAK